ncbi:MAG: hypothetical protein RL297_888 [Pseudomonadota bacterium]|jgi:AsmA protein
MKKALRVVGIAVIGMLGLLALSIGVLYALFDGDQVKAEISRTVLEQKQRTLVIAGQPKLSVWPNVGITLDGVTLSERASQTEFAAVKSVRVSVGLMPLLSRQVQVKALDVDGLKLTLIKNKDGSLNIDDLRGQDADASADKKTDAPDSPAEPFQLDISAIRLNQVQLLWRDDQAGTRTELSNLSLSTGQVQADSAKQTLRVEALLLSLQGKSGSDAFTLSLSAPKFNVSTGQSSSDALTLNAVLKGPTRHATLNLGLDGVQGNADQLTVAKLNLKLDAEVGDSHVKGQLSSPVALNLLEQTVVLGQLGGSLDLAHPAMPMKQVTLPMQGALKLNGKAKTVALDLSTQFDESKIDLNVKESQFSPLALAFDLSVDKLNVDQYLPPKPVGSPLDTKTTSSLNHETPIDWSALKGPVAKGHIRIGALQVANLKFEKINAQLALAGGKLELNPLSLSLYGGSTNGSVSVNAHNPTLSIKQALTGVNIQALIKDLLNKDMVEGRGNVALDVTTRIETVTAMKRALNGSASLALKDGAIKGINLAQSLRDLKTKVGQSDTTQSPNTGLKTDFSELTASFKITNGVAHNDDLSLKSPFLRLGGAGDIDLGAGQMNYLAKTTLVASGEGQDGKEVNQLKGLTVPIRLSGPFDALTYKIQFSSMLKDATKTKVEEKKQEIKAKAEEAVRDKAKDFFDGILRK